MRKTSISCLKYLPKNHILGWHTLLRLHCYNHLFASSLVNLAFISEGLMPKTEIVGSYGKCMFNYLRKCLILQTGCTIFSPAMYE